MKSLLQLWQTWAILSAISAAATAILAKVGVGAISSDLATLIRTAVVLALAASVLCYAIATVRRRWCAEEVLAVRRLVEVRP